MDLTINKLHTIIDDLITKHKDNDYVYGRLVNYIENLLPVALDNATEINKQREARRTILSANQDEFTSRFLQKNHYFYSQPTELFLHYDGFHFVIRDEDDIYHQILSTISYEKCLLDWRHKVNKNIIKRIKERSPLKAIPESITIQFVINTLCPSIFKTRNHVKYFLTIVGDCLLKKKQLELIDLSGNDINVQVPIHSQTVALQADLIYIFPPALKELIREIGNQCYTIFGLPNIFTNIKFKYYDHNYNNCRLISISQKKIEVPPMIKKHMLDFLCVASHYNVRYGSADNFLQHCNDSRLIEHAQFLSKNTQETIVNTFIEKSLTSSTATIDTKNMIFIWKKFLDERNIPNIIFYETLKTIWKKKLQYDEKSDKFIGLTSLHLPIVSLFMRFWEETIVTTYANETGASETGASETGAGETGASADANAHDEPLLIDAQDTLELDEVCILFKHWTNNIKSINESLVIELIQHFYSDVVIENNKYILHTRCKLWNKYEEVVNALNQFRLKYNEEEDIYDSYLFYCQKNKNKYNLLASKQYFEKNVTDIILNELELLGFP